MVRHRHQGLIFAVSDIKPPPLLFLFWEVQAVHGMRDLRLGLQQGSLSPLDALLQGLPLLKTALQNLTLVCKAIFIIYVFTGDRDMHLLVVSCDLVCLGVALLVALIISLAGRVLVRLRFV